jgi:hypothetical protein
MIQLRALLLLPLALSALVGCTDGRIPKADPVRMSAQTPPPRTNVSAVQEIRFNGKDIEVAQITIKANSLYMTGRPFGLMRADIGANAELPQKTFAVADDIEAAFPFGKWVFDWYASGALSVMGPFVFTSGVAGTSVFNVGEVNAPVEVRRYPRENENPQQEKPIQDEAYTYRAMVAHPSLPILYGFREQDFVYTLKLGAGPTLPLVGKNSYGEVCTTKCCVRGATVWQNKVFVAFKGSLVWFDLLPNGGLEAGTEIKNLQAEAIASSPDYLFVYHNPGTANPQGTAYARGVYVFNKNGDAVALLNTDAPLVMAATNDYIYINSDNTHLTVYKINWTSVR